MNRDRAERIVLHALEALYSLVLLAWFVLSMYRPLAGAAGVLRLPDLLRLPAGLFASGSTALAVAAALVYLIPAIRLYKLACLFLDTKLPGLADPRRSFPILVSLASSALALAAILVPVVRQAASWRYFASLPPALIALFFLTLAHNAFFLSLLIARLNSKDESYREYLEFRRGSRQRLPADSAGPGHPEAPGVLLHRPHPGGHFGVEPGADAQLQPNPARRLDRER